MARVEHPNLAMVYDVATWRGTPVLVVEYLSGGTLASRLLDGPMSPAAAVAAGAMLADALAALHDAGILHRDIKPSNVGFTASGTPKLLDFGIASLVSRGRAMNDEGHVAAVEGDSTGFAGTPLYASPDALAGGKPDTHLDMWSLSLVVLQALTGCYPLQVGQGATAPTVVPETAEALLNVPEAARAVLLRGIQPALRDRFTSASAMAVALRTAAVHISECSNRV
jgi:serine/threonine-protein kinase